jgi:hypothetical protein
MGWTSGPSIYSALPGKFLLVGDRPFRSSALPAQALLIGRVSSVNQSHSNEEKRVGRGEPCHPGEGKVRAAGEVEGGLPPKVLTLSSASRRATTGRSNASAFRGATRDSTLTRH